MHEITTQIGPMFLASTAWFLIISGANAEEFQTPEDVVFSSRLDRTEQRYIVLLPDKFDATVPHDVLLALHGHGSDRWQFITDKRPECQEPVTWRAAEDDFCFARLSCQNVLDGACRRGRSVADIG